MFKKLILLTAIVAITFGVANTAEAATYVGVKVRIEGPDGTMFDDTVYTAGCTVTDSTEVEHEFDTATALCALQAASEVGNFEFEVEDSIYGLYLTSINGIEATEDFSDYWSFYANYQTANVGMADYEVEENDYVLLTYGGYGEVDPLKLNIRKKQVLAGSSIVAKVRVYNSTSEEFEPVANATVYFGSTPVTTNADGVAEFTPTEPKKRLAVYAQTNDNTKSAKRYVRVFAKNNTHTTITADERNAMVHTAVEYLEASMTEEGIIGGTLGTTEWAAMAIASQKEVSDTLRASVVSYEPTVDDGAPELARHILALQAIGEDPKNSNGNNYVKRLKRTIENDQFGDEAFVNDDIFAGLALAAAGEPSSSRYMKMAFNAAMQGINDDGGVSYAVSFTESDIDTTANFLELYGVMGKDFRSLPGKRIAATQANRYIQDQQNMDGGWTYQRVNDVEVKSNASSTATVLRALPAFRADANPIRNNFTGEYFLQVLQQADGRFVYDTHDSQSVEELNTAYAILALDRINLPVK